MNVTPEERAFVAAEILVRFLREPRRHTHRVYGLFQGDLMLSWTLSRSYAERLAREKYWTRTDVRHIGTVKPSAQA